MGRILVTGGAGFIGSNIVRHALEKGYEVKVLDNMLTGSSENLRGLDVEFIQGDVLDKEAVGKAVQGVDYVFHEAAASASPQFLPDPSMGLTVNILGFSNVFVGASKAGVKKVVYALSSLMFGDTPLPWKEDELRVPDVPDIYTSSLLERFYIAKYLGGITGTQSAGLVYYSIYGPHEAAKKTFANIVSQFLWAMKKGESPVLFGDGTQARDFTFVTDVARANLAVAESNFSGGFLNVGTGREESFLEVVATLNEELGTDIKPTFAPKPPGYTKCMHSLSDNAKAEKVLGFVPRVNLREGIRELIEFYGR